MEVAGRAEEEVLQKILANERKRATYLRTVTGTMVKNGSANLVLERTSEGAIKGRPTKSFQWAIKSVVGRNGSKLIDAVRKSREAICRALLPCSGCIRCIA